MSGQILLLVHPDNDYRAQLSTELGSAGYRVMTAPSDAEAWQRVREVLQPDAVVAHLGAGENDDEWIGSRLRESAEGRDIPVVVLATDRRRALRHGFVNVASEPADPEEVVLLTQLALDTRQKERGLAGDLEKMSMPDLLQTVAAGARSGRITAQDGQRTATVWVRDGRVIHAAVDGGPSGREAAFELIGWTRGNFTVSFGPVTAPETITDSTPYLLLEAMRLRDEAARQAPPEHAGLADDPPPPTREELSAHLGLLLLNVSASWITEKLRPKLLAERLEKERLSLLAAHPLLERFTVDDATARISYRAGVPAAAEVDAVVGAVAAWLRRVYADVDRALPGRFSLHRLAELTEAHDDKLAELGYAGQLGWRHGGSHDGNGEQPEKEPREAHA